MALAASRLRQIAPINFGFQVKLAVATKLLVVQVAALGHDLVASLPGFRSAQSFFPALTCTAQASFRTAALPREHGMVANGLRHPDLRKILFWEQSSALVQGPRIWSRYRAAGRKVGMLFWQQSLGDPELDLVLSPAPIHKHSGGMIQDCYTQPPGLAAYLHRELKHPFNLMHYWGPLASRKSSAWITDCTCAILRSTEFAPDLLFSYLPHLDYDLQRRGPGSSQAKKSLAFTLACIDRLKAEAQARGYEYLFYGDYAIEPASVAVFPNRALHTAGLLHTRELKGMLYPDLFASPAFAMVDHQIAHVFTRNDTATAAARDALTGLPGIESILDRRAQATLGLDHPRSGALLLIAQPGHWFAYPWWTHRKQAPDFATHVDIHNKPGYDPCELFFGWPPGTVSMNTARIRGSHGRPGDRVAWTSSLSFAAEPGTMLDVARFTKAWLDSHA
jgi:predicted AlkP superfamily pyrophosphatase or phosphodiesterase